MMLNRVAQTIIVFVVLAGCDYVFREVLLVAVLGTYEIQGAKWLWFYGALAVMSAVLVAMLSGVRANSRPIDGLVFGALLGFFFGMSEVRYLAQAVPGYRPVAILSCLVYVGQFAIAGWVLGKLDARYSISQAK